MVGVRNIHIQHQSPSRHPLHANQHISHFIMNSPIVILRDTEHQKALISRFQQHGFVTRIAFQSTMLPVFPLAIYLHIGHHY